MSDSGNPSTTADPLGLALSDLPARPRVHELARRSGLSSREIIAALADAGVAVTSASSSVEKAAAEAVLTTLLGPTTSGDVGAAGAAQPPAAQPPAAEPPAAGDGVAEPAPDPVVPLFLAPDPATVPPKRRRATRASAAPAAPAAEDEPADQPDAPDGAGAAADDEGARPRSRSRSRRGRGRRAADAAGDEASGTPSDDTDASGSDGTGASGSDGTGSAATDGAPTTDGAAAGPEADADGDQGQDGGSGRRRRRGRRGRGRTDADEAADDGTSGTDEAAAGTDESGAGADDEQGGDGDDEQSAGSRRRRRRRRRGGSDTEAESRDDDPDNTVVHVREARDVAAEVQGIRGSTRLEAKRQRRRDSRESRRRPQILTEAEFLARREAVNRVMAVRQRGDLAQVALLEDDVLVEHFVSRAGSASMIGNIYLGRVQNVLPSMEAAFVDIGRGRNAVLYAGEVNWDVAGLAGKARRIETALSSGDTVLVQVSKDPVGHKGARLTTQISLPGRFLVYVPAGGATGISRKLPDTERKRLKQILDRIVPDGAGVIIRTAAEGVPEDELAADVERLRSQWESIQAAASTENGRTPSAPQQLSAEPDTLIKVVRDLFNSDISSLVIDGDDAWNSVSAYVQDVAPELAERVSRYEPTGRGDVFARYRVDEQIAKALERKVHLPSGGSLVIDRTEAMTVVDVNTGKYTGSGGNLEETVTRNNLEAAEEIVRQLRLRDIGGIIVVDFIDMVLESNRELVVRRLTECLGRDRSRHQVAEVTSLGLVQMTRKRMGTGLVEAFSHTCDHCHGRGIVLQDAPTDSSPSSGGQQSDADQGSGRSRGKRRERQRAETPEPAAEPVARLVSIKADPRGPRMPKQDGSEGDQAATEQTDTEQTATEQTATEQSGEQTAPEQPVTEQPATEQTELQQPADGTAPHAEPAAEPAPRARRGGRRATSAPVTTAGEALVMTVEPEAATPDHGLNGNGSATDSGAGATGTLAPAEVAVGTVTVTAPAARPRRRAARRAAGPATDAAGITAASGPDGADQG